MIFECGRDDVWLRADYITVPAIVAGFAVHRFHADQAFCPQQAIESTHRAKPAAPAMATDQQVEHENRDNDCPTDTGAEQKAAMDH